MAVAPNHWVAIYLYKNNAFQLSYGLKKHLLKQVVSIVYTFGKDIFAAATFKGLYNVFFQSKNVCSIIWSV